MGFILLGLLAAGAIYKHQKPSGLSTMKQDLDSVQVRQLSLFWSYVVDGMQGKQGDTKEPLVLAEEWQLADPGYATYSNERNQQRLALVLFYFSTGGDFWTNNTGWLSYDIDECEWFSHSPLDQVCDNEGNYLSLHLDNNNLVGTLTTNIGLLTTLTYLDISVNSISSTMPSSFQTLTNLGYFNLAYNTLNGSIPIGLVTELTSLRQLGVNNNLLTGTIPSDVANLQR